MQRYGRHTIILVWLVDSTLGGWWRLRQMAESGGYLGAAFDALSKAYLDAHNSHLAPGARFASKPSFPQGICGVDISGRASLGAHCTIYPQVAIVSCSSLNEGHPGAATIGDNCVIGVGARIVGGVRIGNNVKIGPNCIVTSDIPENSVVI